MRLINKFQIYCENNNFEINKEQIKIINEQAKARPGRKYVTNKGKVYKGNINNRLTLVAGVDPIAIKKEIKINKK